MHPGLVVWGSRQFLYLCIYLCLHIYIYIYLSYIYIYNFRKGVLTWHQVCFVFLSDGVVFCARVAFPGVMILAPSGAGSGKASLRARLGIHSITACHCLCKLTSVRQYWTRTSPKTSSAAWSRKPGPWRAPRSPSLSYGCRAATRPRSIEKSSTFNTRRASRTGTPSLRQGPATSSFAMRSDSVTWRLAPPCSCRCQVLKGKQKDNLRARAANEDGRKLQAVRFKIKEEMRPGHLSASSQPVQTYIHTSIHTYMHTYIHTFHLRSGCGCEAKARKAAASSEWCCAEPPKEAACAPVLTLQCWHQRLCIYDLVDCVPLQASLAI